VFPFYLISSTLSQYDLPEAIKWFSLCRDYNPKQGECSSQLVRLYLSSDRYELAVRELEDLLMHEFEDRLMLNMLHTVKCTIPNLVIDVFNIKYQNNIHRFHDALYTLLMV
jgi:hypothetical protein